MNRRRTLGVLTGVGVAAVVGGAAAFLRANRTHGHLALDAILEKLDALDLARVETTGAWEQARIFDHLAQSVEFSLSGYPEMKSALFRNTVGSLAFSVFQARGQMRHGLDEEIPGETIRAAVTPAEGLVRLTSALEAFDAYDGRLAPHFAYGSLDKSEYAAAHAMHVYNHFEELRIG